MSGDQDSRAYLIAYAQEPVNAPVFFAFIRKTFEVEKIYRRGNGNFPERNGQNIVEAETAEVVVRARKRLRYGGGERAPFIICDIHPVRANARGLS